MILSRGNPPRENNGSTGERGVKKEKLKKLAKQYPGLKKKGYEVVSIAADNDRVTFENYAARLPWKDRYCDFEGFAGKDFRNYGVIGTPTFYVIDGQGMIQGRYARVEDIEM
jgi:hypothetical protein